MRYKHREYRESPFLRLHAFIPQIKRGRDEVCPITHLGDLATGRERQLRTGRRAE